jgi:CheY-like chemotaxis protein
MIASAPSLLITDDDRDMRETLRLVFEPHGFHTLLAADGDQALRIVEAEVVHLVLLDLHMPRLGGLETLRRLKLLESPVPCIVMSAGLTPELVDQLRQADAYSVLPKPVCRHELTSLVEQAMWQKYRWRSRPLQ